MDDPVAFLEAEFGRVEELARASHTFRLLAAPGQRGDAWVIDEAMHLLKAGSPTAEHIVRHSPAAVLRRVKAHQEILAEHQSTRGLGYVGRDYTEMASACTSCGTSDEYGVPWPCRTGRLLAEAWGWEGT